MLRKFALTMAIVSGLATTAFAAPAQAATPKAVINPGTYSLLTYVQGQRSGGTLSVTDAGQYVQNYYVHNDQFAVALENGTAAAQMYRLNMRWLYVGGLYFTSRGASTSSDPPVLYRPYTVSNVLTNQSWSWTLFSTSGGVRVDGFSNATVGRAVKVGTVVYPVQVIKTTMYFTGNGSGTLELTQFEVPGDVNLFRTDFIGSPTILGQTADINDSVILGLGQ